MLQPCQQPCDQLQLWVKASTRKLSCIFIQIVCVRHVMKFYHSTVDIPWGLVRTFCEEEPQVIDYNVAANPNQSWFLSHGNERFRFSWE